MILLVLIVLASAAGTFIPPGLPDVYHSWWFIVFLSLLGLSLFACTLKRLKLWRTKFGSSITHIGLLVILAGALISAIAGQRGFLIVSQGQAQDVFLSANNKFKKLDFKIYLDDFSVEWYDSIGAAVKDFKSKLAVLDEGKIALTGTVRVNHPLKYKGWAFYQASYDSKEFNWSGLEVVKDPGVPFVFFGFILLNAGVVSIFYFKPR